MKLSKLRRRARAWLLLGFVGFACGQSTVTTSSETNWFTACARSEDCREGSCQCGVCTIACDDNASCDIAEKGVCALADSPGHAAQCGAEASNEGVCLPGCDSDSNCSAGQVCTDGVCVAEDETGTGGSTSTTTGSPDGGAGGEDDPCPQNPRAHCAMDCSGSQSDCGAETSSLDENGCARLVCMSDADCGSGERCFGVGVGEPELCISMFTCMEDEQAGGCVCGGGGDCYPGYCVPR